MKLPLPTNAIQIIDELGDIERKLKPLEDLKTRRDELRAQVLAWTATLPAGKGQVIDGRRYAVHVSERRAERKWKSMLKVFQLLGPKEFTARCSLSFKAAKEVLSEDQIAKLVAEEQTGPRSVLTVPRLEPAAERRKAA